jgi:rod shape-determining protein MreD
VLQIFIIPLICYLALLVEFCLFNLFGRWGTPQLLLLVVIFFNLYSGIRFSLWAAFWAGILADCFSTMPFGTNVFAFVTCAYLSTLIRKYAYERGSALSKRWMVFALVTAHTVIMGLLHNMIFDEVHWADVLGGIWLPQALTTVMVTLFVFERLQLVAKRLRF